MAPVLFTRQVVVFTRALQTDKGWLFVVAESTFVEPDVSPPNDAPDPHESVNGQDVVHVSWLQLAGGHCQSLDVCG